MTDFGADVAFRQAAEKIKEHYGIDISPTIIQKVTEKHAKTIGRWRPQKECRYKDILIAEIDGGMVPIVETANTAEDLRKTRQVSWKEAKLCFARAEGEVRRTYAAVIGTPEEAGEKLYECAKIAGLGKSTYVHALGDGAQWIVEQVENQFGSQAHFLIDFFHLCEYLAEAAPWCDALNPKGWLKERKDLIKDEGVEKVFLEIKAKVKELVNPPEENGLIKCMRYMEKRIKYMNYKDARKKNLPIGSGEIESSHRHVVQKRLKIAGAWWKIENANAMLGLRTARANGYWRSYWKHEKEAA